MRENKYYKLQGHTPVVTTMDQGWEIKHVGNTEIKGVRISTVFFGMITTGLIPVLQYYLKL